MNATVNIPDEVLRRTMLATGASSVQEAVIRALQEFVSRHDQFLLVDVLGTLDDGFLLPEDLDEMRRSG